jgi:hypothetical protein
MHVGQPLGQRQGRALERPDAAAASMPTRHATMFRGRLLLTRDVAAR